MCTNTSAILTGEKKDYVKLHKNYIHFLLKLHNFQVSSWKIYLQLINFYINHLSGMLNSLLLLNLIDFLCQ